MWMVDMKRFFELVVFNYIYANGDAHLKNFSLIRQGEDFRLTPAYDLLNTALHIQRCRRINPLSALGTYLRCNGSSVRENRQSILRYPRPTCARSAYKC